MQEPIEPMEDLQPIEDISINDGELSFENVDFKYDIKTILSNVSFLIPRRGERICWSVGFRKSTILI